VITLVQIVAYLAVAILIFGAHIRLAGVPLAIPVLGLTILTFCALGVISAAFIILTKRGDPVTLFAAQSSAFLAGALFPTTLLPGALEAFTRLIPAYWGMEAMRRLLLTDAGWSDVAGPIFVLCLFVIVMVPSSFAILRWALRSARRTGTLGTY
jgi:ABC-2 type transport system permease protein